jgi:acetyl-CoA carboxylase biotin carboxyl carrier protein
MNIDFEQLKGLLEIVSQNDISELTVEAGEERITVKKPSPEFQLAPHMMTHVPHGAHPEPAHFPPVEPAHHDNGHVDERSSADASSPSAAAVESESKNNYVQITSPMVGTFYRSSSPTKPVFVEVGDNIESGQTICIIEAMKLMNDLPSEVSGRVIEILASNGATVEYGQPLFLIDPAA